MTTAADIITEALRLFGIIDATESAQPADAGAPRRFADYRVHIDTAAVPSGVTLRELI